MFCVQCLNPFWIQYSRQFLLFTPPARESALLGHANDLQNYKPRVRAREILGRCAVEGGGGGDHGGGSVDSDSNAWEQK